MAVYRLAVLSGNRTHLPDCFVRHYRFITSPAYRHALQQAERLNAVICGWRAAGC